ncbi:serine hydrolase [Microbacterium sp.]|uniref:serine hydrolase domain-containing protein n=1 Tax=Microbacterium sp. TaxID=51671 RepID=UPI00262339EB|nr:serine hydrolase domain-containing protein [Microbacterium sp.]
MPIDVEAWGARLDEFTAAGDIPALSLAVLDKQEVQTLASGVLNLNTEVGATTDSVFQIGSVTKAYTATLLLMLVDEGRLDLDEPLIRYLPELAWADEHARAQVTARHLLTHTSGIDGDHFLDLGRGEDVLERYVATCDGLTQVLPVGAAWSYCNTGFAIAGRLIEKLAGTNFDQTLRERLLAPLGLSHSCSLPEEALRHRAAFGHVPSDTGLVPAPAVATPRTMGPAGGIIASASDLLSFARLYLDGGVAPSGQRLLSEQLVQQAWSPQVSVPDRSMAEHWGLGWMITHWSGKRVVGHDGGTVGQGSFMRILPDDDVAVVLVGNGPGVGRLMPEIVGGVIDELCAVGPQPELTPGPHPAPSEADWYGVYERVNMRIAITATDSAPEVAVTVGGLAAENFGQSSFSGALALSDDGTFITDALGVWMPLVPFTLEDGTASVHFAGRAQPRVA